LGLFQKLWDKLLDFGKKIIFCLFGIMANLSFFGKILLKSGLGGGLQG
jgi:hypothetical protein